MDPHAVSSANLFRWLVSPAAAPFLEDPQLQDDPSPAIVQQLRKSLTPAQCSAVLSLAAARRRAANKFPDAACMFFTDRALQQATDFWLGAYKASCYPTNVPVVDLGCGIGGDLMAMARRGPATGVDRDQQCSIYAAANGRSLGLNQMSVRCADIDDVDVAEFLAWHIDPDRRVGDKRTVQLDCFEPNRETLKSLLHRNANGSIKLAPATTCPEPWQHDAHREWIGLGRECKQQWLRFGTLAAEPGRVSATIVTKDAPPDSVAFHRSAIMRNTTPAQQVDAYIFAPHACLSAAGLTETLANSMGLTALNSCHGYFTSDRQIANPFLVPFRVEEVLPLDVRQVRMALAKRQIGTLELKQRGTKYDLTKIRRQLKLKGTNKAVLLLVECQDRQQAVLAQRIAMD